EDKATKRGQKILKPFRFARPSPKNGWFSSEGADDVGQYPSRGCETAGRVWPGTGLDGAQHGVVHRHVCRFTRNGGNTVHPAGAVLSCTGRPFRDPCAGPRPVAGSPSGKNGPAAHIA